MGILGKTAEDVRAPPWPKWRTVGASAPGRHRAEAQATDTPHKSSHGGQNFTASPRQNTKWKNRKITTHPRTNRALIHVTPTWV